jgi:hypothetical protein
VFRCTVESSVSEFVGRGFRCLSCVQLNRSLSDVRVGHPAPGVRAGALQGSRRGGTPTNNIRPVMPPAGLPLPEHAAASLPRAGPARGCSPGPLNTCRNGHPCRLAPIRGSPARRRTPSTAKFRPTHHRKGPVVGAGRAGSLLFFQFPSDTL